MLKSMVSLLMRHEQFFTMSMQFNILTQSILKVKTGSFCLGQVSN